MSRPLRDDSPGSRQHQIAVAVANERTKPNLAGFWVCLGVFVDVDDPGNDPACTSPSSPAYQNSWAPAGAPYADPAFRHGLDGRLEFRGVPEGGTFGTVLTTLPAEWRPDTDETHYHDILVGSVLVPARWVVDASTGDVTIEQIASGGGGGEWVRLGMSDDFTITKGGRRQIEWDTPANHDPSIYDVEGIGGGAGTWTIDIQAEGVYALTWSLYVDVFTPTLPTNVPIWVSMQRTTWTVEEEVFGFPALGVPGTPGVDNPGFHFLASPIITGTKVFRAGIEWGNIYLAVTLGDDADDDLGIIGGDLNISYMEIVRLVPLSEQQTDPNDFAIFP